MVLAQDVDTLFIKDMYSSWQTFNEQGASVPYFEEKNELVFFELQALDSGSLLKIETKLPFDIWINNQIFFNHFEGTYFLDIDSISNAYLSQPTLTFYADDWREGDLSTKLYQQVDSNQATIFGRIERRGHLDKNSYLIVGLTILLLAGALKKSYPNTFSKSYRNPLSLKLRGLDAQDNYQGFLSFDNLMAIFYLGVLGSFLSYYLGFQVIELSLNPSWELTVPIILIVAVFGAIMIIVKYLWSVAVSSIFQFKELPNVQNQDFIHFLILLTTIGLILSVIDYSIYNFTSEFIRSFIIMTYVIMLIFFQFWMILKLDKLYAHRKLMIISYLCTTEFVPGFIIITWLMKS